MVQHLGICCACGEMKSIVQAQVKALCIIPQQVLRISLHVQERYYSTAMMDFLEVIWVILVMLIACLQN